MFSSSAWYQKDIEYITNFNIDWHRIEGACILITGATGLIGTVLVDALMYRNSTSGSNVRVLALARSKAKVLRHFDKYRNDPLFVAIEGDIVNEITLSEQKIDFIINLASNTHPALYASEPIKTIDTIVAGVKNMLELAAGHRVKRIINTSSVEVYGENKDDVDRFTEDYCGYINCNTLRAGYTEGKRLAEAMCQAYMAEKDVNVVSVRLGRVYGSTLQSSDSKATSQFIHSAVNRQDIVLKSDGEQKYSFVYVADAATAYLLLLTRGKSGEAYNVADDEVISFRETAEILAGINGKKVKFNTPNSTESKGFSVVRNALMDSKKVKAIGWGAKYQLKDGLQRTVSILRSVNDEKA